MLLFDFLYFLLALLLLPLWGKVLFKKEYRTIFKHRLKPDLRENGRRHLWLHAVSVGEVKSINHLIRRLNNGSGNEIVLSVTTPSGYDYAKKEFQHIKVINAPVDLTFVINRFIDRINPEILVLNELEIWPNWVSMIKKRRIPILLINGRISDTAFKRYRKYQFFFKRFFRLIDFFLIQAEAYKKRFVKLGIPEDRIKVCGNIKADEADKAVGGIPSTKQIFAFLKTAPPEKKIVTLASTHASDEKVLIPVLNDVISNHSVILVPRHLERVPEIEKRLQEHRVPYHVWSRVRTVDLERKVLLFDQIGYLLNIIDISGVVIMGGTFDPKIGGHNLYEPAALGKLILGGPHYNNFPDIGAELMENGVYRMVREGEDITTILRNLDRIDMTAVHEAGIDAVRKRTGSTECIINQIQQLTAS